MTSRTAALAVAACLLACGGARKESRAGAGEAGRREGHAEGERKGTHQEARRPSGAAPTPRVEQGARGSQGERAGEGAPPKVASSPEALLGREQVAKMQQALASKKLLGAHRQGELDAPTTAAIRRFQEQQGLAPTGLPDKETMRELGASPAEAFGRQQGGRG